MVAMENDGRPQLTDVDRLIHEPSRFNIMALLYVVESADFLFVERQTALTAGNLSAHISRLEAAGYISIAKDFVNRRPHTMLTLTSAGRAAFEKYRLQMKQVFGV